ncbi:maleylpyruvate isomerase family mycothiol-dependent enzyme [Nocardia sp. KC 131]|uniref:maleylpyruvate isomerase family mycothiol-dependent enzyme n=1 Tax=Nocardia arseniciresistens TaxID=3392119 RepID=UPI00398E75F3
MTMNADDIWRAVATERATLVDLLATLADADWNHDSLCEGWRIRDVVAHLILPVQASTASIIGNLIRARGSISRMGRDTAIRHAAGAEPGSLLAEMRATIDSRRAPVGTTPADRLMDLLVHGQDIAIPLGLSRDMPTAAAHVAIERIWGRGYPFHASKKWTGYRLVATDTAWAAGSGPTIEGPVAALLLLVTGRTAAVAELSGSGVAMLLANR